MRRAALALLALAFAAACRSRPATTAGGGDDELWVTPEALRRGTARIVEVREQELPQAIAAAGRIAFDDQRVAHVLPPVSGQVTRILAALGQHVERGTPLLALASPEAGSAFADVARARADLAQARAELERQQRLVAAEAAPQRDLEAARDAARKADAELARAEQRAKLLRASGVDEVTQDLVLRSPIAGDVLARAATPGMQVQGASSGTPVELVTVGDIGRVWVLADVPDVDLPHVAVGAGATIRVAAWPARTFRGKVDLVAAALDPGTRTARVRLTLDNPDHALEPEMLARVDVDAPPRRGLAVPHQAIVHLSGGTYAYVGGAEGPDGRRRFVRRRIRTDDAAPLANVTEGLTPGDRVAVEHTRARDAMGDEARLSPGQLEAAGIRVETAAEQEISDAVALGGRAAFDEARVAHVFSPVTGRVARVLAAPGDHVRRGAPLLTLISPDVGSAFADAVKAQAGRVAAQHERDRQRELVEAHAGARRDLEAAEASYRKAVAEVARAEEKTRLLRAGTFDAVTQEFTVRSPIDGEVVARAASPGLEVQGQWGGVGAPVELFTVGALDPLWILGDVYELDLPHVRRGDAVTVRVPALPGRALHGTVDWVSDVLDPALRTGKVRCAVPNPDRKLRPEMAAVLSIAVPARRRVAVPREAILRLGDDTIVFVAAGTSDRGERVFRRRRVIVGEEPASGRVPIADGLVAGESVVVRGGIFLVGLL